MSDPNYDYRNPRSVESDIEDWKPEGSGARKLINRDVWNDDEVGYYVYWMRSLPGERNGLNYEGRALTNWWHLVGDFDSAREKNTLLVER